jgi:cell fate (sporulation/competence/biofilm development) regulator YlbF (YheA/YmcA/DUF963 family)
MEKMNASAAQLAKLLQQTAEFQELLRLARLVEQDPDVIRHILQIRQLQGTYSGEERDDSVQKLHAQLEALPAYQAYVKAEKSVCNLFQSVNQIISSEVRLDFAVNTRRKGCSCGG